MMGVSRRKSRARDEARDMAVAAEPAARPVSRNRMTPEQNDPPVKIYQVILNPQSL